MAVTRMESLALSDDATLTVKTKKRSSVKCEHYLSLSGLKIIFYVFLLNMLGTLDPKMKVDWVPWYVLITGPSI